MIPDIYCTLIACIVTLLVGFLIGRCAGYHEGRAFGWQEGYFGRIKDDRKKRDSNGRFVAVK